MKLHKKQILYLGWISLLLIAGILPASAQATSDLMIKGASEPDAAYQTDNVYQQVPSGAQVKTIDSVKGDPVKFQVKLQNDSNTAQSYYLKTEESTDTGWTVDYSLDDSSRIITTYAGGGSQTADGTDAKSYKLSQPCSVAYDHHGNLYVGGKEPTIDYPYYGNIWKIDTNGIITKIAGNGKSGFSGDGGPAINASISCPKDLAFDANDNLYFADSTNKRVRRIDEQTGIITTIAGNGKTGISEEDELATDANLNNPVSIALDSSGDVYISDYDGNRILKVDASTKKISTFAGTGNTAFNGDDIPASQANLCYPNDIALDSAGNLYIAEGAGRLRKVDATTGIIKTIAGNGSHGSGAHSGDGGLAIQAGFIGIGNICLDKDSNIFLTDNALYIRKIDAKTGIITTIAGNGTYGFSGDGGSAFLATFEDAYGITINEDSSLVIADCYNNRIRMIGFAAGIQNTLTSGGYVTPVIPAQGSFVIDATLTPKPLIFAGSQESVIFKTYSNITDTTVRDSVNAIANLPTFDQPDLLIKKQADPDTSYAGNGIYQAIPADVQILKENQLLEGTTNYQVKLQNMGDHAQSFLLKSMENDIPGWTCNYSINGESITAALAGGYLTPVLNLGDSLIIDIAETYSQAIQVSTPKSAIINVYNDASDTTVEDSVQSITTIVGPDLMIKGASEPDTDYQIDNVYQQVPSGAQIKTIDSVNGGPVQFQIKLQNDQNTPQSYYLTTDENTDTRWTVNYSLDDSSRIISTVAGGGISTANGTDAKSYDFPNPYSIAYDHHKNLYIGGYGYIWKIDTDGKVHIIAGNGNIGFSGDGGSATSASISGFIAGLAFDADDNLYFADSNNERVRKINDQTGIITTLAGTGNLGFSGDNDLAVNAEMYCPYGIAVDSSGNVFFSDCGNNRVRKIDASTQIITTFAGRGDFEYNGDNIPATVANLDEPKGICFDPNGNLYIVDSGDGRIREVSASTGEIQTIAGNGSNVHDGDGDLAIKAGIRTPVNICLDTDSNIYLTEDGLYIRRIDGKTGIITTFAGSGQAVSTGDGGLPTSAGFACARGIATSVDGYLMIADQYNGCIRMIELSSAIQTAMTSGGYSTLSIPAQGSILINVTMTPNTQAFGNTDKSVIFKAYPSKLNSQVGDSVEAIAHLPIFSQPDLLIKKQADPDTSYEGDSIYQQTPTDSQILKQDIQQGETVKYQVKLQNKGDQAQTFLLKSVSNPVSGWSYACALNGQDLTATLAGSGYTTSILNPGYSVTLDITETASLTTTAGIPETVTINAYNDVNDNTVKDSVMASAEISSPDLLIKGASESDTAYQINNVYQPNPSGSQIKTIASTDGNTFNYQIKLENDSDTPQSYYLKTHESADTGWTVNYALNDNSRDINTFAGGGINLSDGTDAKSYLLDTPASLTYDLFGDLYVGGYRYIYKIDGENKVSIVAGNGVDDFSGDGGPATSASVSYVMGLAFDASNNIYFTDYYNNRVRRIDALTGIITTIVGNGTQGFLGDNGLATNAELSNPTGIVFDSAGNLYVSDYGNNRIRKIDHSTQIIKTFAGTGTTTYNGENIKASSASLYGPVGLATDPSNNLYLAECDGCRIRKIDAATGLIQTIAGNGTNAHNGDGGIATQASIQSPVSICLDNNLNLYLTESCYARKINSKSGIITTFAGNGTYGFSGDGGPAIQAALNYPGAIDIQSNGTIQIADSINNRIRIVDSSTATLSGGYTTTVIPAYGNTILNLGLVPNSGLPVGSKKDVLFEVYKNSLDTIVRDSVEAVAQIGTSNTYAAPTGFIHSGWNLVSLPTDPVSTDVASVFTGIDVANSSFQYWNNNADPCVFQPYGESFGWTGPAVRGVPYWFLPPVSASDTVISYQGTEPTTDYIITIPAHTSAPYWIAIGTPFPSAVLADNIRFKDVTKRGDNWLTWTDAFSSASPNLRIVDSSMQGWDNSQGSFVRMAPTEFASASDKTQFDPWWGYWMLVFDNNELKIQFPKPIQ